MDQDHGRGAVVIATRNRPDSLLDTVKSVVAQTRPPEEICIVDSSDEAPSRPEIEALCEGAGLRIDYVHPAARGSCHQRNEGIDRTTGDPIIFIDDDVWLEPDCFEEMLAEYDRWGNELGGVAGSDLEPERPAALPLFWRRTFGMSTWTAAGSGRVKAGFYVDGITVSKEPKKVEYMNGWLMSYRRKALEDERFDEALSGYAQKEDVDLAYRVSRRYTIIKTPRARGKHYRIATARLSPHDLVTRIIENQMYLHKKNMPRTLRHRLALGWALFGFGLLNLGKAIVLRKPGFLTGFIRGIANQVRGKGVLSRSAGQA